MCLSDKKKKNLYPCADLCPYRPGYKNYVKHKLKVTVIFLYPKLFIFMSYLIETFLASLIFAMTWKKEKEKKDTDYSS